MSGRGKKVKGACALCGRETALTFHHLVPKKLHRRAYFQKNFTRAELSRGIAICRLCHDGIHDRFDEMTLARNYSTPEQLREDAGLRRHFAWASRQKKT